MRTTHRMLLRIWHDPDCDFSLVKIGYLNRGAVDNCSIIQGTEITRLENRFMIIKKDETLLDEETYIPYHRIRWIEYNRKTIWDKPTTNLEFLQENQTK